MSSRDDALLLDMVLAARTVARHLGTASREEFDGNEMMQDAVVRQLMVLGEAAAGVSDDRQAALPQIPWHRVIGLRHRLVHDYRRVRLDIVWDVASRALPELLPALEAAAPDPDAEAEPTSEAHGEPNP